MGEFSIFGESIFSLSNRETSGVSRSRPRQPEGHPAGCHLQYRPVSPSVAHRILKIPKSIATRAIGASFFWVTATMSRRNFKRKAFGRMNIPS